MSDCPTSLYIHIPFCDSLCPYCDFTKVLSQTGLQKDYIASLLLDLSALPKRHFKTIYVGGGTPSSLEIPLLEALFSSLEGLLAQDGEFTVEGNPESLSEEKIALLAAYGINRVSMGVQSANPKYLAYLQRGHNLSLCKSRLSLLRRYGITNINLDLMYGFKGQTLEEVRRDIDAFISLSPSHISTYSLMIEPNTVFALKGETERDEDFLRESYDLIVKTLEKAGFLRYEVSNFAKAGMQSRHNLVYWRDEEYIGLGAGASGYEGNIRYSNTRSIQSYIASKRVSEKEIVTPKEDRTYYLLTHLRLAEGFSLSEFESRFHEDLLTSKKEAIEKLLARGLIRIMDGRLSVAPAAMYILDSITVELLD